MYNRYDDIEKFITDPDKLQMTNGSEVYISCEEDFDIVVDLQGHTDEFEQLKPYIAFIAWNVCDLDNIAQKFDKLHSGSGQFPYSVAVIFIDDPFVIFEYWGTEENTQFDVVFEHSEGKFMLKSFGTVLNISPDWEEALSVDHSEKQKAQKKGCLHRLIDWLFPH